MIRGKTDVANTAKRYYKGNHIQESIVFGILQLKFRIVQLQKGEL